MGSATRGPRLQPPHGSRQHVAAGLGRWAGLGAAGLILAWSPAPGQVFHAGVELVQVWATVKDHDGRLVGSLGRDDFAVYEDGVEQRITQFTPDRLPVSLGILVDVSDSMFGQRIVDARRAIDRFVLELLDPGDEAFVMVFNHEWDLVAPWTRPPRALAGKLDSVKPFGGTALYDALIHAADLLGQRRHERCGLVIISDGTDTASDARSQQASAALSRTDAFVYAIAIDAPAGPAIARVFSPQALNEITGRAGGYTEIIHDSADLAGATERIATELNHQYTLAYTPAHGADGAFHSIRVQARRADLLVRARRGYYAVPRPPR